MQLYSGLHSYLLDKPQTGVSFQSASSEMWFILLHLTTVQGNLIDLHGKVIRYVEFNPDQVDPVYTGPLQVLGPGFAPFKPYVRLNHFYLRVNLLLVLF